MSLITKSSLALLAFAWAPQLSAQTLEAELSFGNATPTDEFGASVGISGDTAVFGSTNDRSLLVRSGTAIVFVRAGGSWSEEDILRPSDGRDLDRFGTSVAIDGDTVVVGSPNHRLGGGGGGGVGQVSDEHGAAYVYVRSGGVWTQQAKLTANDNSAYDNFGFSVDIEGDTIIVGAPEGDAGVNDTGAAYIFVRSGSSWSQQDKLTASDASVLDRFGRSVAIDEDSDTALVGAYFADTVSDRDGAAYVYTRSGSSWSEQAKLSSTDPGARFGSSVDVEGDQALVGAVQGQGQSFDSGSAFVFNRTGSTWSQSAVLSAPDGQDDDSFGRAVSLSGNRALISAFRDDDQAFNAGAAWLFTGGAGSWDGGIKLVDPNGDTSDGMGSGVSIDGDLFVVGSVRAEGNAVDSGAALAYTVDDDVAVSYCDCATSAPCANEFAGGGCENSTSGGAILTGSGTASVAADNLTLTVSGVPAGQFGIIFMGGGQVANPFGDGTLCVGAGGLSICRYAVQSTGTGSFSETGIVAQSQGFEVACRIDAGETWNFQAWFRDPGGPCGSGFNLSNGVSVNFLP